MGKPAIHTDPAFLAGSSLRLADHLARHYHFVMPKIIRITFGWLFLLLGVAGLVLPILQGWLFLALGALMLSSHMPFFARIICRTERRYPRIKKPLARIRRFLAEREEAAAGCSSADGESS